MLGNVSDSKVYLMQSVADRIATPASLERIVFLDLLIWLCQLVSLEVTYITAHTGNIPHSPSFPYPDYLLPPSYEAEKAESEVDEEPDKVDDDVESGLKRRRRKGFESAFEELDGDMDALWLNKEDGPGGRPRGTPMVQCVKRMLIMQHHLQADYFPTGQIHVYVNHP